MPKASIEINVGGVMGLKHPLSMITTIYKTTWTCFSKMLRYWGKKKKNKKKTKQKQKQKQKSKTKQKQNKTKKKQFSRKKQCDRKSNRNDGKV